MGKFGNEVAQEFKPELLPKLDSLGGLINLTKMANNAPQIEVERT